MIVYNLMRYAEHDGWLTDGVDIIINSYSNPEDAQKAYDAIKEIDYNGSYYLEIDSSKATDEEIRAEFIKWFGEDEISNGCYTLDIDDMEYEIGQLRDFN